jgi:hypothetical protein
VPALLGFQVGAIKVPLAGDAYYQSLSRAAVAALQPPFTPGYFRDHAVEAAFEYATGDVVLFETTDSDALGSPTRFGKVIIRNESGWGPTSGNRCGGVVDFDDTIFTRAGDPQEARSPDPAGEPPAGAGRASPSGASL